MVSTDEIHDSKDLRNWLMTLYQYSSLKDRDNSRLIKILGRKPRRRGLKHRGRGTIKVIRPLYLH